jgi:NADH dehydrogenase [ubiquinone] 1 alpha subcomplex assembly factor 7
LTAETEDTPPARIAERLRALVRETGPLPIAGYMATALFDPAYGYYATRDPIGAGADFITAPEISQIFGEVIGLWLAEAWNAMGRPSRVQLIELGPGKGTLMTDILRAGRALPGFLEAAEATLVEASPALKMVQGRTLASSPVPIRFADRLEQAPAGPSLVVANEFLDCLPFRQAVKVGGVWRERCVGLDPDAPERFVFTLGAVLDPKIEPFPPGLEDAADGSLVELRPGDRQIVDALAARFTDAPGQALFVDYGPAASEPGDTLQALKSHEKVDPLAEPGTADLTAHVDFAMLSELARGAGLSVAGPATQGDFLMRLGAGARAQALSRAAPTQADRIARQLERLTHPAEMGTLFKAIALRSPDLPEPPGFAAG